MFTLDWRLSKKETTQKQKLMNLLHSVKSLVNIPIANANILFSFTAVGGNGLFAPLVFDLIVVLFKFL